MGPPISFAIAAVVFGLSCLAGWWFAGLVSRHVSTVEVMGYQNGEEILGPDKPVAGTRTGRIGCALLIAMFLWGLLMAAILSLFAVLAALA